MVTTLPERRVPSLLYRSYRHHVSCGIPHSLVPCASQDLHGVKSLLPELREERPLLQRSSDSAKPVGKRLRSGVESVFENNLACRYVFSGFEDAINLGKDEIFQGR